MSVKNISAGPESTCAVLTNGTARCWGRNNKGQLGDGTATDSTKPVEVRGLTNIRSISAGYQHTCAVLDDGTARCWGNNSNGELGNDTVTDSSVPVVVTGLSAVIQIYAGVHTSCAQVSRGPSLHAVHCWGRGGELGDGTTTQSNVPRPVPGLDDVVDFSLSSNPEPTPPIHACGVRSYGPVFCWGNNSVGQLGDGTQNPSRTPVTVLGFVDARSVTAGGSHACARRDNGVSCWGAAQQIGDGTVLQRPSGTALSFNGYVNHVSAGAEHTFALTSSNQILCWGSNTRGQCGDGAAFTDDGPINLTPRPSTFKSTPIAGSYHSCSHVDGVTWCAGSNEWGQLGFGTPGQPSRTSVPDFVRW